MPPSEPRTATTGQAITRIRQASSLGAAFRDRLGADPGATACLEPEGRDFRPMSTQAFADDVDRVARALLAFGVDRGDRLGLMGPNGPWWASIDLAALSLGAVVVPLYQGQQRSELRYILEDAAPALVCVQGTKAATEMTAAFREAPYAPPVAVAEAGDVRLEPPLQSWEHFLAGAPHIGSEAVAHAGSEVGRANLATLVYTSGTTGWPKGVELTHGNLLANLEGILEVLAIRTGDRFLSFLPLAHIFERTAGHLLPYLTGCEVAYARGPQAVPTDLLRTRPTILVAVPRLYQMFHDRAQTQRTRSRTTDRLLQWATGDGGKVPPVRSRIARWLLGRRFRQRLGGRIRLLVSGGAALAPEVARFFRDVGLPILEGYGQTETAPVVACNRMGAVRIGTVGPPLPNVEVQLASDGEIQVRGPNVMRGYWNREEENATVFEGDWLRTGDVGEWDGAGYLQITDRLKEILVTSGGKNIPPQRLELRLTAQPLIQQAVIFGDRQPYLGALIVPDWEDLWRHLGHSPDRPANPTDTEAQRLVRETVNQALADLPAWEQVRRFNLLAEPLGQEEGELTPTLKVKRRVVAQRYADEIEALFAEER
ncbi:AMP-dependent synthetase/ligase [Thiohalorhabdus sp.]|uniref:AMP-dependent synthetase/ligase n=1 Tax=Thiohalorhabdus sp. TaxID=3094134 RepID=UPI002FC399FA